MTDDPARIRPERSGDEEAISALHTAAFGTEAEARLVERLREADVPRISLVAVDEAGGLVGHILFTPVTVAAEGGPHAGAMGLGPMAVRPALQRKGIGGRLVEAGLAACRERGVPAVFVLGHRAYYPRFGFAEAAPRGLHFGGAQFDPYFFVLELTPGALDGWAGRVRYHPAFDAG